MTSRGGSWERLLAALHENSFSGFCIGLLVGFFIPRGFFPSSMKMERGDFDNNFVFGDYYLMWTHCLPVESKMIEMHRGKMLA